MSLCHSNPKVQSAGGAQVVMHDLLSGAAREIVRTHWDGKQPTALAFLYANAARLLGFVAGDNSNEILLGPVLAVGSASGSVTLLNLTTLQVSPGCPVPCRVPYTIDTCTGAIGTWWKFPFEPVLATGRATLRALVH